ncbi:hypothetical protein Pyn_33366 [Prunus yedoensis var. nudiflora]|uniref:Uncharacterized protein n=1 Tax=Prunus yedoensis var. nudiflora TaxID=2094558 RepID=A0A314ZM42_PRUYE|nr:hypothetical protein Pyn_33366 [Prunus yedoensis var. nudiflora]
MQNLTPLIISSNGAAEDHRARACDELSRLLRPIQGVLDLVKSIGEARSKAKEEHIFLLEMETLKRCLSEPEIPKCKMKEYIIRLIYVEMLGNDGSFVEK